MPSEKKPRVSRKQKEDAAKGKRAMSNMRRPAASMPSAKKPRLSRKQKEDAAYAAFLEAAQPREANRISDKQGSIVLESDDLMSRNVKKYLHETLPAGQYYFEKGLNGTSIFWRSWGRMAPRPNS